MRERHAWIVVTAVLATSLAWLTTLIVVLGARACAARCPETVAVLRAAGRAAWVLGQAGWPVLLAASLGAAALLALLWRSGARVDGRTGHA
jgi:hypothetical protein